MVTMPTSARPTWIRNSRGWLRHARSPLLPPSRARVSSLRARDFTENLPSRCAVRPRGASSSTQNGAGGIATAPPRYALGFTLIEILVVLVIIAVTIAFALMNVGVTGRDSAIDDESRRIEGLMGLLQERAALEGHDFGLLVEPAAYQFVVYRPRRQRWENLDEEREFRRRELPKGLSFELQMDSRTIVIKDRNEQMSGDAPQVSPQIVIAASGENTPFKLSVLRAGTSNRASVNADAFGKLTLESSNKVAKRT